jgi:hypothetical protein
VNKRENDYQSYLIKRIEELFPGCLVLKNDEQYLQGIPDLTVLYGSRYAVLEVKRNEREARNPQPNQEYYVDLVNDMGSFADFVYPENENEVLRALQHAFESGR